MIKTKETTANCECGALTLHIEGSSVVQLVCHCSDCRDFSGMPYVEVAFFEPDACSVDGQVNSTTMKGGSGFDRTNYSCAICKTPLYIRVAVLNGAWAVMANRISSFKFEAQADRKSVV